MKCDPSFRLRTGVLALLCLFFADLSAQKLKENYAPQDYVDTVFVEVAQRYKLVLVGAHRNHFKAFTNLNERVRLVAQQREKILIAAPDRYRPVRLVLDERAKPRLFTVTLGANAEGSVYNIDGDASAPIKTVPDSLLIYLSAGQRVLIYLEGLDHLQQLAQLDLDAELAPILQRIEEDDRNFHTRPAIKMAYQVEDKKIVNEKSRRYGTDLIEANIAPGFSMIRGEPVLDFSANIRLILANKRNVLRHSFGISTTTYFYYQPSLESPFTSRPNQFLEIEYGFNSLARKNEVGWTYFRAGLLTSRSGNLFDSNTYKFSLITNSKLYRNITVAPEIYFYDSFSKSYPGLRIGLTL
ncbi:MAG: hypothetical protein ACFB10_00170 [Salibacteraceae bacterium]